jgi:hypothetical protein
MFSILRPSLVYTVNRYIADHDDNTDAEEWSYNGLTLWRGSLDVSFREFELDVFWLYNDVNECIGLAEHDSSDHSIVAVLFYKESPFGTLFQEDWVKHETIWSKMNAYAYQDFLNSSVEDLILAGNGKIITPEILLNKPDIYECSLCNKKSMTPFKCSDIKKKPFGPILNPYFIDESYIIYTPPANSAVWSIVQLDDASLKDSLSHYSIPQEHPDESVSEIPVVQHPQQLYPVAPLSDEQQPHLH